MSENGQSLPSFWYQICGSCNPGTFQTAAGSSTCSMCRAGTYLTGTGMSLTTDPIARRKTQATRWTLPFTNISIILDKLTDRGTCLTIHMRRLRMEPLALNGTHAFTTRLYSVRRDE